MELPRAGGPERAEPGALRLRRRWDPVSARPVSRGPSRLGAGWDGLLPARLVGAAPSLPEDPSVPTRGGRCDQALQTRLCTGVSLRRPAGGSCPDLGVRVARPLGSRHRDPLWISLVGECAEPTWELRVNQRAPFSCMGRFQEGYCLGPPSVSRGSSAPSPPSPARPEVGCGSP